MRPKIGMKSVLLAFVALTFFGVATAFAANLQYGSANIAGGQNFDSDYLTWKGGNTVSGSYRKCAGQATINNNFYGSYACATSGSAIKTYPSTGSRRARAHNGESFSQTITGVINF